MSPPRHRLWASGPAVSAWRPCAVYAAWRLIQRCSPCRSAGDGGRAPPNRTTRCNAMRLWSALQSAMRTRKTRRIGLTEADRLVAGNPPDPGHRGLGVLLDAATAPPSVEELAGDTAAVPRRLARPPAARQRRPLSISAGLGTTAAGRRASPCPPPLDAHLLLRPAARNRSPISALGCSRCRRAPPVPNRAPAPARVAVPVPAPEVREPTATAAETGTGTATGTAATKGTRTG